MHLCTRLQHRVSGGQPASLARLPATCTLACTCACTCALACTCTPYPPYDVYAVQPTFVFVKGTSRVDMFAGARMDLLQTLLDKHKDEAKQ
jgi:hypothetical protein